MDLKSATMKRAVSTVVSSCRAYSAPAERSIPISKRKYVPTSGTYPKGFLAGSAYAGVKASNTKYDDIALVVSERPCAAAGVFTRNVFKAAPVSVSQGILMKRSNDFRGVVVNSGCANAVTSRAGKAHAIAMARTADRCINADTSELPLVDAESGFFTPETVPQTLVMSTGVIGQKLPIEKITSAIPNAHASLGASHEHWMKAAAAICTTDTFPKLLSRTFRLPSHPETEYRIAGMVKGAGMIHPNMGTLLGIVCTDADVSQDYIRAILQKANRRSFNCISVDGDTSTNDTIAFFANGAAAPAGVLPLITPPKSVRNTGAQIKDSLAFEQILKDFMIDLAKLVVRDGEGATKFVTIHVTSTTSQAVARKVASSIATSALVKTALYGKDANWGRILCAIGYTPNLETPDSGRRPESVRMGLSALTDHNGSLDDKPASDAITPRKIYPVVPNQTSVSFIPSDGSPELELLVRGEPAEIDENRAKQILEMEDLEILVKLNDRKKPEDLVDFEPLTSAEPLPSAVSKTYQATYYTCDFSHEYVTINGDYRT